MSHWSSLSPACTMSSVVSNGSVDGKSIMDRSNSSKDSTSRPSTLGLLFSRASVDVGETCPRSSFDSGLTPAGF